MTLRVDPSPKLMPRMSSWKLAFVVACVASLLSGCGASGQPQASDPLEQIPAQGGLRDKIADAQEVTARDFPAPKGRSMKQLARSFGARQDKIALASSVFVAGSSNRLAFGAIDDEGQLVFGKSAVYVADSAGDKARGPYPAPADPLVTEPAFRSKQAATETDPFAAVYAAEVPFKRRGNHVVLTVTESGDYFLAATGAVVVRTPAQDEVPAVGERAPEVKTDTLSSAGGNVTAIDTREPPSDMHERSFDEVVGRRPVALLFATPQLCQSRVCGPVVDVALQLKRNYGDRVEFIHQEVYRDNDPNKGVRDPLRQFNLPTEPWLFVVNRKGEVTARLEGSFGLTSFEQALLTGLR